MRKCSECGYAHNHAKAYSCAKCRYVFVSRPEKKPAPEERVHPYVVGSTEELQEE